MRQIRTYHEVGPAGASIPEQVAEHTTRPSRQIHRAGRADTEAKLLTLSKGE